MLSKCLKKRKWHGLQNKNLTLIGRSWSKLLLVTLMWLQVHKKKEIGEGKGKILEIRMKTKIEKSGFQPRFLDSESVLESEFKKRPHARAAQGRERPRRADGAGRRGAARAGPGDLARVPRRSELVPRPPLLLGAKGG